MTTIDIGAVLVGFLAFLSVFLAPIVTSHFARRQARNEARHEYIRSVVTALIELRGELQYHQLQEWNLRLGEASFPDIAITDEFRELQFAFGKAYAIMISTDIEEIRVRARDIMDNNLPSEKLDAIDFALKRLGEEYGFFK